MVWSCNVVSCATPEVLAAGSNPPHSLGTRSEGLATTRRLSNTPGPPSSSPPPPPLSGTLLSGGVTRPPLLVSLVPPGDPLLLLVLDPVLLLLVVVVAGVAGEEGEGWSGFGAPLMPIHTGGVVSSASGSRRVLPWGAGRVAPGASGAPEGLSSPLVTSSE